MPRSRRRAAAGTVADADRPGSRDYLRVERRLRHLEVEVMRRLDGILQGDYRGLVVGVGTEPGESRLYNHGDDLRRVDWRLTARTGQPHVRDTIADRELELWVVVDDSPSLAFGTARCLKWDLALGAIATVTLLATRVGNRVGAVQFGGGPLKLFPAQVGRDNALRLLASLERDSRLEQPGEERSTLAEALSAANRLSRRRGMVAIVSDFQFDTTWDRVLRAMRSRHDVLAFEVLDPRELALPPVGLLTLVDSETGRVHHVQTSKARTRARYAEVTGRHREEVRSALRTARADHAVLRTDTDWVVEIARFVARRRLFVRHGAHRAMVEAAAVES